MTGEEPRQGAEGRGVSFCVSAPADCVTCPPSPTRSDCLAVDPEKPKPKFVKEVLEKCMRYQNSVEIFLDALKHCGSKSSIPDCVCPFLSVFFSFPPPELSSLASSTPGSRTTSGSSTSFLQPSQGSSQLNPSSSSSTWTRALVSPYVVSQRRNEPLNEA